MRTKREVATVKQNNVVVHNSSLKVYRYMYTQEISEHVPSLFRHGAQIGGLLGFPVIKITVVRQVRMSPAYTVVRACR